MGKKTIELTDQEKIEFTDKLIGLLEGYKIDQKEDLYKMYGYLSSQIHMLSHHKDALYLEYLQYVVDILIEGFWGDD